MPTYKISGSTVSREDFHEAQRLLRIGRGRVPRPIVHGRGPNAVVEISKQQLITYFDASGNHNGTLDMGDFSASHASWARQASVFNPLQTFLFHHGFQFFGHMTDLPQSGDTNLWPDESSILWQNPTFAFAAVMKNPLLALRVSREIFDHPENPAHQTVITTACRENTPALSNICRNSGNRMIPTL
ncbi:MAG: hypothetical protein IPJ69_09280 [Deltaproteobacteria bacterium]|nr:MAG: hypothetical protein IPJ69_09280 [Deltaproteobacteria bacterium]